MRVLSVSQWFSTRSSIVKSRPNHWKIVHPGHLKKRWVEAIMKVVFFCIIAVIDAMVLPISSKQIKLDSCACAQIEAFEV